jgi:hypothetical protein
MLLFGAVIAGFFHGRNQPALTGKFWLIGFLIALGVTTTGVVLDVAHVTGNLTTPLVRDFTNLVCFGVVFYFVDRGARNYRNGSTK